MYYVKEGRYGCFIGRAPKMDENATVGRLSDFDLYYYDYDDEKRWPDDALRFEARRVREDPRAMEALKGELKRRSSAEVQPPWFDDFDEMWDDLELAVEQEEPEDWDDEDDDDDDDYDSYYDYDDEPEARPIIHSEQLDEEETDLIRQLASLQREEAKLTEKMGESGKLKPGDRKKFRELLEKAQIVRNNLISTDLAEETMGETDFFDNWERVESIKDLAAQLLFMYGEDRLAAEAEGKEINEDFFLAGMNLYRTAAKLQKALETGEMSDYLDVDDDLDFLLPRDH